MFGSTTALAQSDDEAPGIPYHSVWALLYPQTLVPRVDSQGQPVKFSPMIQDFYAAARSKKLKAASSRWRLFCERYGSVEGDFEDAVQEKFWKWGSRELERCRFLLAADPVSAAKVEQALRTAAADE